MSERGDSPIFAAVLAAGKGTRMKSNRAKVLHTICGVPMVNYAIAALEPIETQRTLVVVGHQADEVKSVLPSEVDPILQKEQRGTGDAVRVALEAIDDEEGILLVVNGDGPLISYRTLAGLIQRHRLARVGATVLVAELVDPAGLGRVMEDAGVVRIVEERDATEAEKEKHGRNSGPYASEPKEMPLAPEIVGAENAQGEL